MKQLTNRILSLLLVLAILAGFALPVTPVMAAQETEVADKTVELEFNEVANSEAISGLLSETTVEDLEENSTTYEDTDSVRVSIILEEASTLEAGFSTTGISVNADAIAYRKGLEELQKTITADIEAKLAADLDVQWNLTLAANIISATVLYGQIEDIKSVDGVKDVVLETRYEPAVASTEEIDPNMSTSGDQIGTFTAWANGYTGAGSRIAVIDTGTDTDHQSFSIGGWEYSIAHAAGLAEMPIEEYKESLNLLDAEEIASVLDQLNIEDVDPERLYINEKLPFGYNYIDVDYDITHDHDDQGEHGSHVAGIATANAYIPAEDGTFNKALTTVYVQGVAPDAQLITMKVFGKDGGAYDSDYMAAIEDAIVLGCDAVNLSLGTVYPGFSYSDTYAEILANLENSDTVVATSASNAYGWATNDLYVGYNYADEVSMSTAGSPGSYFNTLSVASVNNLGLTGYYFQSGEDLIFYNEYDPEGFGMDSILTLAGEQEYIFIDGIGSEEDWEAVGDALVGKVAFCSRGTTSFYEKANEASWAGAIATVIYNNQPGTINMDLTDYEEFEPCVFITQEDGALVKANSTPVTDENGNVLYYTGTITISSEVGVTEYDSEYQTISDFSSWGVPGSLILKPEITAPGGNIYSINGLDKSGTAYENMSGTSMSSPQVAGMVALLAQYIKENNLQETTGLTVRALAQSLLMSTAEPIYEEESGGNIYSVMRQGAGVANIGSAVTAGSYLMMAENATVSYADGKIKAELGDDPEKTGEYSFSFTVNDLDGKAATYTLSSDFFTQDVFAYDDELFLDTWTAALPVDVTYIVNGEVFRPVTAIACDLDGDADTDADDAQVILNYAADIIDTIDAIADLDGDGAVTTYDAYLLLTNMTTTSFTVAAGEKAEITVNVKITDSAKEYLNTYYEAGAYVEGYVYVNPCVTDEGAYEDVVHSVPVLGFYGNWSDSSMYEDITYTDYLYGDWRMPHNGIAATNNLIVKYKGDSNRYYHIGNPYFIENDYPAERAAINSGDSIYQYTFSMMRNASALAMVVTDEDGEIIYVSYVNQNITGEFYYVNAGAWYDTVINFQSSLKLKSIGVEEGQTVNVSLVAVPEYYRGDEPIDEAQLRELITSDTLGDGAYLTTTLRVDNTAPEATLIAKDLETGNLLVNTVDNQYVAAVLVYNMKGELLAGTLPYQTAENQLTTALVDLSDVTVNEYCTVVVADYANNRTSYEVYYGGEPESYAGLFYGFTPDTGRDVDSRWVQLTPETLYYANTFSQNGMKTEQFSELDVIAAEYYNGNVFMFASDGCLYVAEHGDWDNYTKIGSTGLKRIYDMAYNYADNTMYALQGYNYIYSIDLTTGQATKLYRVSIENPRDEDEDQLVTLAIDDEGNFYSICAGGMSRYNYLFKWSNADVDTTKNVIRGLEPINNTRNGNIGYDAGYAEQQCMAWDHDNDKLYWAASRNSNNGFSNYLCVFDLETGKASQVNDGRFYQGSHMYDALLFDNVYGLYIVPTESEDGVEPTPATGIELNTTSKTIFKGGSFNIRAFVMPWTAADRTVTWTTSNEMVATVDADGNVKGVGAGEAIITATANIDPTLSASCTVTVNELDNIELKGLSHNTDSTADWVEFDSNDPSVVTAVEEGTSYISGAMMNGKLIVHNGSELFEVDPDSFKATSMGPIASSWIWSDAVHLPANRDIVNTNYLAAICMNGTYIELLDPYAGTLNYFDFSKAFENDPMCLIAYDGVGVYNKNYATHDMYMMTETGNLYKLQFWNFNGWLQMNRTFVGNTGINMTDVALITAGAYGSMILDEATGYLIVTSYTGDETTNLYAVDPATADTLDLGSFPEGTAGINALYQYDRIMELTVLLNKYEATSYTKETVQLVATVKPWYIETGVVWTSSDETVATVDENGLVTCLKDGDVTITATSVEKDEDGNPAVAKCEIKVLPTKEVDIDLVAQIETADGKYQWISFNATNPSKYTVESTVDLKVNAGTGHDGLIYADTTSGVVMIDPEDGYKASTAVSCGDTIYDMTTAPAMKEPYAYVPGIGSTPAVIFDNQVFIGKTNRIGILTDATKGTYFYWFQHNIATSVFAKAGAIAYTGKTKFNGADAQGFTMLDIDGKLYSVALRANTWNADGTAKTYIISCKALASTGLTFSDVTALQMVYVNTETQNGYLVCDTSNGVAELTFIDMSTGAPVVDKVGTVAGAVDLTAMYSVSDMNIVGETLESNSSGNSDIFAIWEGTETQASSTLFMCDAYCAPAESVCSDEIANEVSGNTNTAAELKLRDRVASAMTTGAVATDNSVEVTITEEVDFTNGLYQISYDPAVLTFDSVATLADIKAVNVDADNGIITLALATAAPITTGNAVAAVNFTYTAQYINTELTITTMERNDNLAVEEDDIVLSVTHEAGGHNYVVTESVAATCEEDGYAVYTCSKCGDSYTEVLPALGHNYQLIGAKEATCEEDGYTGDLVCQNCGDVLETGEVIPAVCYSAAYEDLDLTQWYHEYTDFVIKHELMNGTGETTFSPNATVSRAMMVTVLYRLAGSPAVETAPTFTDVVADSWYADAVVWAQTNNIVKGMSETEFAPNADVTREQAATILFRYVTEYLGVEAAEGADLSSYVDGENVSAWAAEAMSWAVAEGLFSGFGDATLKPTSGLSRVQIAKLLTILATEF